MSQDISSLTPDELSRWIAERNESLDAPMLTTDWWLLCDGVWLPRSYTDPEICLRLLKMIIDHDKDVIPDDRIIQSYFDICDERAIAEAYALANGYRPEGGK